MTFRLPDVDERQWVARIRRGDSRAFAQLYQRYYDELCEQAYRYVSSADTARDVVDGFFAKMWETRSELPDMSRPLHYFLGAVRNLAINAARHENVERRWRHRVLAEQELAPEMATNAGEAAVESDDLAAKIREILRELPERCQRAFVLRWQRQLSIADIAAVLRVSPKTVEKDLSRAKAALMKAREALRPLR